MKLVAKKLNVIRQHGFTLIELMVTITIISILSAIALPTYKDYLIRGKIPDAIGQLAGKRVLMEQFFQDNLTYVGASACTEDTTSSKYFTFSCSVAATASVYTLQAVGKDSMAGFTYTVDQDNVKTTIAPSGWMGAEDPTPCWITGKGGQC